MAIRVFEDEDASGGFAFLDLGRKLKQDEPKVSIRRLNAEPRNLGVDGWQFEPAWLAVGRTVESQGATILHLGPHIVDHIEELVCVEISIEGEGTIGQVTWPAITPSPQRITGISLYGHSDPKRQAPLSEVGQTEERPEYEVDTNVLLGVAQAVFSMHTAEPDLPIIQPRRRSWPLVTFVVLVLFAAAVGSLQIWRPDLMRSALMTFATLWDPSSPGRVIDRSSTADAAPQPRGPSRQEMSQRYSEMLTNQAAPARLLEFGRQAMEAGHAQIAFRAFEEANPSANEEAAWEVARFYDPRNDDVEYRSVARADAARAARYYAAWKGRSPRHATELAALCAHASGEIASNRQLAAACRA